MKQCPKCKQKYGDLQNFCPVDGTPLEPIKEEDINNDPLVGQMLDIYRIEKQLGAGGFGIVYKALQPSIGRVVCIKTLHTWMANKKDIRERFVQEAKTMALLKHPNIITLYSYREFKGTYFLVMEFIEGPTLSELIEKGAIPLNNLIKFMHGVCTGLDYAHKNNVVHRDLKPHNILLEKGDFPKIIDFGISRILEGNTHLTATGFTFGTPEYMSPEQAEGRKDLDWRTDIYSLGITLYYSLTGKLPFTASAPLAILYQQVKNPPPSLREINPDIPEALEKVILKALEKDREKRFQNATDLFKALYEATTTSSDIIIDSSSTEQTQIMRLIKLGCSHQAKGELEKALEIYHNVLELDMDNPITLKHIEEIQEAKRQEMMIAQIEDHMKAARSKESSGYWLEALSSLEQVLKLNPEHAIAKRKIDKLREKLKIEHTSSEELVMKELQEAMIALSEKQFDIAIEKFNIILEKDPDNKEAREGLDKIANLQETESNKAQIQVWMQQIEELEKQGDSEKAIFYLEKILDLAPNNEQAQGKLAQLQSFIRHDTLPDGMAIPDDFSDISSLGGTLEIDLQKEKETKKKEDEKVKKTSKPKKTSSIVIIAIIIIALVLRVISDKVKPPKAVLKVDKKEIQAPGEITFSATNSTGNKLKYAWDFGDTTLVGETVTRTFQKEGNFKVLLIVTNKRGKTDTAEVIIKAFYPEGMVFIKGGEFQMGFPNKEQSVSVNDFYIDKYEVTNIEFHKFIETNSDWNIQIAKLTIQVDDNYLSYWENGIYPEDLANHPVHSVSWYAADAYAKSLGKRLPTEIEWEYAARSGLVGKKYPWGDDDPNGRANYCGEECARTDDIFRDLSGKDEFSKTAPVGQFSANSFGLYDMCGNVWEWTSTEHNNKYIARGGSWGNPPVPVYIRFQRSANLCDETIGFRLVEDMNSKE